MSCSVAVCNSPVFSPSNSLFCNKTSTISSINESVAHLKTSTVTPPSPSVSGGSPTSPFRLCLQKSPNGLRASFGSDPGHGSGIIHSPPVGMLKRKRPAKLDIPIAPADSAAVADTPREKRREVEREGDGFSVYCVRGRREAMEDRFSAVTNLHGDPKQAIFGVFDGHGGAKAAEFAANNLDKNIIEEIVRTRGEYEIEEAVKHGYLNTDAEFVKEKEVSGGSCCVTALIHDGNLVVANAGDCRAVLSVGGVAHALTSDHKPSREDERFRIESTGGYVDTFRGVWRIQGSLAVSRSIGDIHLKQWVIAEPETKILRIEPEHEFLILASDGLWDKVSNQEAVDIARPLCQGTEKRLLACKNLAKLSASRGSYDDISVMVIPIQRFIR